MARTLTRPTRFRSLIAADPAPVAPVSDTARFHMLMAVEGVETGDSRIFMPDALTWRELPLPVMAKDTDEHGSLGADTHSVLIGNIDRIERRGAEVHGWGSYIAEPAEEAARMIGLVQRGELRGVSVDVDDVDAEVLVPVTELDDGADAEVDGEEMTDAEDGYPRETDDDGQEWIVLGGPDPKLRVNSGRIMGATVVPFPAFQEAFIEPDGPADGESMVAAGGLRVMYQGRVTGGVLDPVERSLVAAARPAPAVPPRAWFEVDEPDGPCPLTFTDDGQVFGHLALAGECHIGVTGECVTAPRSPSGYARYMVGEIEVDDGSRVAVGRLTYRTGHAATSLRGPAARAHYDDTGSIAAYLHVTDGKYGVWACGAAHPDLTAVQRQEVMASPPSGDWRSFGGELDMVAALCVNVPGFNTPRVAFRREGGLVASLILSNPAPEPVLVEMDADDAERIADRIAASIGRSKRDRIAVLSARVHGGR